MKPIKYLEELTLFHRHLNAENATVELLTSYAKLRHLYKKTGDEAYKNTSDCFPTGRCPSVPIQIISPNQFEKELREAKKLSVQVQIAERVFDLLSAEMARCSILGLKPPRRLIRKYCRVLTRNSDFYPVETIICVCAKCLMKCYPSGRFLRR
jgi:hypothetical protein